MKKLFIVLMVLLLAGCATKYNHVASDGSKLNLENYAVTELITYSSDGKILKSKLVAIPMYEGMIGKLDTLIKPVLDLLLEY